MKIALLHYHLQPGGVTTVVRQQVDALQDACRVVLISGKAPPSPFPVDCVEIPGLGYDAPDSPAVDPGSLADAVFDAIQTYFDGPCDVLHVHNPTLAKNRSLLKVLRALQQRGIRLLLQIHDFAEDGRPRAYFSEDYPADCHYAVLNSRDYAILSASGLARSGLPLLPNTVRPLPPAPESPGAGRILYPVRAIRRKNIGEAILLSLFFPNQEQLAVTLPPNSPADMGPYAAWKAFAKTQRLPVAFEVGLQSGFFELVRSSRMLVTTSVTEGFGFSFLEAWTAGRLLWGRKLPDICRDFERVGLRLDHLYHCLRVPVDWIDPDHYYESWQTSVLKACRRFDHPMAPEAIQRGLRSITAGGVIDFALLNEGCQRMAIERVRSAPSDLRALVGLNPFLRDPGVVPNPRELIAHNRTIVLRHYNQRLYRQRLHAIYAQVVGRPVRQRIDKARLLARFMDPARFGLLQWECDES
ncbi:MAG: hypothetical protein MUP74_01510 [Desulfobacterales bacterium]|nr:hypothetical protein [Desulfobacterales bacterium]